MRTTVITFLSFLVLTEAVDAAEIDLTKRQLTQTGHYATQVVAAKNNTGPISALKIECGFFRGTELLAAGMGIVQNVEAGQTVYVDVIAYHADGLDKTECRVGNIVR
jgi:hypothetical protein